MLHLLFSVHGTHDCQAMVLADDVRVAMLPDAVENADMLRSSLCYGGDITPETLADLIIEHEGKVVSWH